MIRSLLIALGLYFFFTGVYIFVAPETFYEMTPGLAAMGPFNFHFIRDVAMTFLACGGGLTYAGWTHNRILAIASAAWPLMHGLFHLQIWVHRGLPFDFIWFVDAVGVIIPGLLAMGLALKFRTLEPAAA